MKTLFISDLDGTLLDRQAHLSEETIRILRPMIENGLWFTAATARSLSAVHLLSPLRLKLPCVQLNGVLLYDFVKRDYISSTAIDPQAANAVLSVLRSFGRMAFVYKSDRDYGIHVEFETLSNPVEEAFFEARKNQDYKSFSQVPHITAGEQDQVIYFTMVDAYERLAPICQAVQAIPGVRPTLYSDNYSDLYFLEIFCSSATPSTGWTCWEKAPWNLYCSSIKKTL